MEEQLDLNVSGNCEQCSESVSEEMMKLASEDGMHLCIGCREQLAKLRVAVQNAQGGRFRTGI